MRHARHFSYRSPLLYTQRPTYIQRAESSEATLLFICTLFFVVVVCFWQRLRAGIHWAGMYTHIRTQSLYDG